MGSRILIVDDNPWVRRMVGTMLERGGHHVETAQNGVEGLHKATQFAPDLVMTDVVMEEMDGWTFVRRLRANPETSMIPVIFLTALDSEEDRIRGFRLGADDYLPKPFRFEELNLRVERTLRSLRRVQETAESLKSHDDPQAGLRGDLSQLGISAIFTILEMERKSGVLLLQAADHGRAFLRGGRIIAACVDGDPGLDGADAVYRMLTWSEGTFTFTALDVDMEDQIEASTSQLLMEGARRVDEQLAGLPSA